MYLQLLSNVLWNKTLAGLLNVNKYNNYENKKYGKNTTNWQNGKYNTIISKKIIMSDPDQCKADKHDSLFMTYTIMCHISKEDCIHSKLKIQFRYEDI